MTSIAKKGIPAYKYDTQILKRYRIIDSKPEQVFDNIVSLASKVFEVPMALISIIDSERIFFKANCGIGTTSSLPLDNSFSHLINKYRNSVVYKNNFDDKIVVESHTGGAVNHIHFYASIPLITFDNYIIGTLCIADTKPRRFTKKDKMLLQNLARVVMDEIELRRATIEETEKLVSINKTEKELKYNPRYIVVDAPAALGMLHGTDLIIESANNELLSIWGKTQDVIGKSFADALPELVAQNFQRLLLDVFATGTPYFGYEVFAYHQRNNKSEEGYFNFVYHPLKDAQGKVISIFIIGVEVTNEIKARQKVEYVESVLRMATEAGGIGTWNIDAATRYLKPSARLKEMFGYAEEENMTIESAIAQVDEAYRDSITRALEATFSTGCKFDVEAPVTRNNDRMRRWVRAIGAMYPASTGIPAHFSGSVIDISESKRNDELKNDFIAMVSHDLKSPLTALKASLQLLQGLEKEGNEQMIDDLYNNANSMIVKMTNLLNGYLDIGLMEAGKIYLIISTFNIRDVINDCINAVKGLGHKNTISVNCPDDLMVVADKTKIEQVINNLLTNAVKFSYKSSLIEITCTEKNGDINLAVKDQGPGIPGNDLPKLFGRFYRGATHNEARPGFGVGLYICAEIIRSHKGFIWAESKLGKGSVFYFQIPKSAV